jgi:Transposase DDE domain group 1
MREGRSFTVDVTSDGAGLVSHAGAALVAEVADRTGLTRELSRALAGLRGRRRHDPGRVVRDLGVMLADGGDCLSDLRAVRDQQPLFGPVASDTTAFRLIDRIAGDAAALEALRAARARARACAWELGARPQRIVIDVDATLIGAHTEKEGAAVNFKGTFGFHPLLAYLDESREALAGILRPGNAAAHSAADQIAVLEQALEQLPREVVADLDTEIVLRTDSAGSALALCQAARDARIAYLVGFDLTKQVRRAILSLPEHAWRPALRQNGEQRDIDHEQDRLLGIKAAIDEIGEQRPGERRVLGRAFPEPERDLDALGADPERDDVRALGDLQAVEHHHRQPDVVQPAAHQFSQRGAGALDEHLRHRRLRRRRGRPLDLLTDGLADPREPARRDAGEHPVHHRPRQRVAIGEVPVGLDRQLVLVVGRAHPRTPNLHAPAAQRHRPALMAVTHRDPVAVVLALRAHDLGHLELQQLAHDTQPDPDAQREQPLPRCPDELAERLLNLRWERTLRCLQGRDDLRRGYLLHGGSSCPRGLGWRLSRSQAERTRREDRRQSSTRSRTTSRPSTGRAVHQSPGTRRAVLT